MEILNRLDDCWSTQNHLQLGSCLSFEYFVVFWHHDVVDPFWQIELFRHAEHFRHVFEVHSVFLPVTTEELPPLRVLTCLGKTGKTIFSFSDDDEREVKYGEQGMAKGSLNISSSSSGGSSTATGWVVTVPSSLLFPWSGVTDILSLE